MRISDWSSDVCSSDLRDFGEHIGELQLHDLVRRERAPELLAFARVTPRRFIAEFGRAHRAPADAVARAVEATERTCEPRHIRQQRTLADLDPAQDRKRAL